MTWTRADKTPAEGATINFILVTTPVTFMGWYHDGRYNAYTEDPEQVWFSPEDIECWQYAHMPNDGEVAITEETSTG